MIVAGCYVMHVECDNVGHKLGVPKRGEFTAPLEAKAIAAARDAGWFMGVHATYCPACVKAGGCVSQT